MKSQNDIIYSHSPKIAFEVLIAKICHLIAIPNLEEILVNIADIKNQQNIIIFPQGTRVPIRSSITDYPYQSGIVAMYKQGFNIIPVALNSGLFWPKNGLNFKKGTITLQFMPAIEPNLSKEEFLSKLENITEQASNNLLKH